MRQAGEGRREGLGDERGNNSIGGVENTKTPDAFAARNEDRTVEAETLQFSKQRKDLFENYSWGKCQRAKQKSCAGRPERATRILPKTDTAESVRFIQFFFHVFRLQLV